MSRIYKIDRGYISFEVMLPQDESSFDARLNAHLDRESNQSFGKRRFLGMLMSQADAANADANIARVEKAFPLTSDSAREIEAILAEIRGASRQPETST